MNKTRLKNKVINLRKKGLTYSEIETFIQFPIPKSTLSFWCKNISLSPKSKRRLHSINLRNLKKARIVAIKSNYKLRTEFLHELDSKNIKLVHEIGLKTQKLILSILYLTEGAKYPSTKYLSFCSSDERIIKLYLTLLNNIYNTDISKFRLRIQCRYDQNPLKLIDYWHGITKIKKDQFYPVYIDKRSTGKITVKKGYKGVCTINYFDTSIQLENLSLANVIIDKVIRADGATG